MTLNLVSETKKCLREKVLKPARNSAQVLCGVWDGCGGCGGNGWKVDRKSRCRWIVSWRITNACLKACFPYLSWKIGGLMDLSFRAKRFSYCCVFWMTWVRALELSVLEDKESQCARDFVRKRMEESKEDPRSARAITAQMEAHLYKEGILGEKNPRTLLTTVYLFTCKYFGIWNCEQHRQIAGGPEGEIGVLGTPPMQTVVCLNKDRHGKVDPISVIGEIQPSKGLDCPVRLMMFYFAKAPQSSSAFYWETTDRFEQGGACYNERFEKQALGWIHWLVENLTLESVIKTRSDIRALSQKTMKCSSSQKSSDSKSYDCESADFARSSVSITSALEKLLCWALHVLSSQILTLMRCWLTPIILDAKIVVESIIHDLFPQPSFCNFRKTARTTSIKLDM